jgi:hypothetical protein
MNKLRKATHQGVLRIGDIELPCFVLDDGTRVISGRGMTKAIGMKGRGQGTARIAALIKARAPSFSELALAIESPLVFSGGGPLPTQGYSAPILVQLCEAMLEARDSERLKTPKEHEYAKACYILMRSFAKVGIIALVDEATGYQADRDREELQKILAAYVAEELLPWTCRFPSDFYKEMFRLRNWQFTPISAAKGPRYAGKLTNKLVYEKLPPGVLEELRRLNPANQKWQRKHKLFQFLTDEIGNPHLEKQVAVVTTLMKISPNWKIFERNFGRAFPHGGGEQQVLPGMEEPDGTE